MERHEPWRELYDRRLDLERPQGAGRLEAEQAAADDRAADRPVELLPTGLDELPQVGDVVDRAVDEGAAQVLAGHRWHGGVGAGREDEGVVGQDLAGARRHRPGVAVDALGPDTAAQRDERVVPQLLPAEGEVLGVAPGEVGGEGDAVVGRARLLAQQRDGPPPGVVPGAQRIHEPAGDHAAADDDELLRLGGGGGGLWHGAQLRKPSFRLGLGRVSPV